MGEEEKEVRHIAIIPDGNRRWAKEKNKSIYEAYEKGIKKLLDVAKWSRELKVKTMTAWGFSTENFNRSEEEKRVLWKLFSSFLDEGIKKFEKKGKKEIDEVRINFLGRIHLFPREIEEKMKKFMEITKDNGPYTVNFMMAYGGRAEIIDAVNKAIKSGKKEITEEEFEDYLYTRKQPDPDIILRTGGEKRLSGYLPWQGVYSELIFIEKYWPDFSKDDFKKALEEFKSRKRRFGK